MSRTCEVEAVNHEGRMTPLGIVTLTEEPGDFLLEMDEDTRRAILGHSIDSAFLVRGFMDARSCGSALQAIKSFVEKSSEGYVNGESSWYWVERWVHVRRPQFRRAVSIQAHSEELAVATKVCRAIIRMRNLIHADHPDYGVDRRFGILGALTASQYPSGGGFMVEHNDTPKEGTSCVLAVTKRGVDFQTGGLYARTDKGEFIDIDAYAGLGDLMCVRSDMRHGVAPIDPELEMDRSLNSGRWMLFSPQPIYWSQNEILVKV